jgi:tetratricopeptide (TPR) repeat protein
MLATIITIRPEKAIISWELESKTFDQNIAKNYITRLNKSLILNPDNSKTYLLLARLHELLAFRGLTSNKKNFQLAEEAYKGAITYQPTWDIAWVELANFYSETNQNKEAIKALTQTIFLGPYEYDTQVKSFPLILKYWTELNSSSVNREQIKSILVHVFRFRHNKDYVFSLVLKSKDIEILQTIKPLLKYQSRIKRFNKVHNELLNPQKNDTTND